MGRDEMSSVDMATVRSVRLQPDLLTRDKTGRVKTHEDAKTTKT